jgi:hypothetical protein
MVTLKAREIKLEEVRELLGFELIRQGRFEDFLTLQPVSPGDSEGLDLISSELFDYLENGRISEGQM